MPDDFASFDTELVTSPGHGAVGVFQAPQPVRPRTNGGPPVDSSMDIDSPFLDLFGGAPAPAQAPAGPDGPDDDDLDFGFDFDDRPTAESPAASAAAAAPPESAAPESAAAGICGARRSPRRRRRSGRSPRRRLADSRRRRSGLRAPFPDPQLPDSQVPDSQVPDSQVPDSEFSDSPVSGPSGDGPAADPVSSAPYTRAPVGPPADFFDDPATPDSDYEDWPDDARPDKPAATAPSTPTRPVSARAGVLTALVADGRIARPPPAQPAPGVTAVPQAFEPPPPDAQDFDLPIGPLPEEPADLPATMPEKAPARQQNKAPAKRKRKRDRDEPDNLPAVRSKKEVKPAPLRPHKLKFSDRDPSIELADHRDRRAPDLHAEHGHRLVLAARGPLGLPAGRGT